VTWKPQYSDDTPKCALCGRPVNIPTGKHTVTIVRSASGERTVRALLIDGRDVHVCPLHAGGVDGV
jgi:hypothetical protein